MASRTSNPTTCPVCSKEFNAKREKVALNQHIQRAAASKDPTISKSQQQWLDDHTVHDNERERARNLAALNSARVQRWRASHPGENKEQNANAEKKMKTSNARSCLSLAARITCKYHVPLFLEPNLVTFLSFPQRVQR